MLCPRCDRSVGDDPAVWRCPGCRGPLDLEPIELDATLASGEGVWRYAAWLPKLAPVSLGEPTTPLVEFGDVLCKLEGALPTGSFKDRGAALLVAWLADRGVESVVEDSSGNAGAALAAYCARAGIACELFVPADAPPAKLAQIRAFGAHATAVDGPREASTEAAIAAAEGGTVYASHAYSPLYLAGTSSFAHELSEQLGGRAPDAVVFPVGGGALLLGAALGFEALVDAGRIARAPRLICAQAAACAPLARAFERGLDQPVGVEAASATVADGIRIARPVRGAQVLAALRRTEGSAVAVEEDEIVAAHRGAAARGLLVERTSAVALAAAAREGVVTAGEQVVVAITGNGLKTPPPA